MDFEPYSSHPYGPKTHQNVAASFLLVGLLVYMSKLPLLLPLPTTSVVNLSLSLSTMKQQNLRVISLWLLLLISLNSISSTARLQPHHQGKLVHLPKQTADNNGIIHLDPSFKHQNDALFFNDEEMEVKANDVCDEEDDEEDCRVKRRMVAEAHLDYIYTQGINNNSQGVPP